MAGRAAKQGVEVGERAKQRGSTGKRSVGTNAYSRFRGPVNPGLALAQPQRCWRLGVGTHAASEEQEQAAEAPVSVQDELDQALSSFSYEEFENWLNSSKLSVRRGERVSGAVIQYQGNKGALIDIGGKTPAFVATQDASLEDSRLPWEVLPEGEENEFIVIDDGRRNTLNRPRLSRRQLIIEESWGTLEQCARDNEVITATITGTNRGGALVKSKGVGGFIPSSHLLSELSDELLGQEVKCTIMDCDRSRNRLILSNRNAMAKQMASEFNVGDVITGRVVAIKPYGAFVEAGSVSALLHKSQISAKPVQDVSKIFSIGDTVKALVMSWDPEKGRLSLSTRKLEPNPGDMLNNPANVEKHAEEKAAEYKQMLSNLEAQASGFENELENLLNAASGSQSSQDSADENGDSNR